MYFRTFNFIKLNLIPIILGLVLIMLQREGFTQPPLPAETAPQKIEEFTLQENDSNRYILKLAYDSADRPAYFYRNVFTPVCYTHVCKPVYINLYWDLLGNYLRYDVPPGEPLTKVDHEEFEPEDYDQLHSILANPNSILKDFTIYELVDTNTYHISDSVDAVTGATPQTIKNEVIGGAVYTCFTIWHIVNGQVVDEIKDITEQQHIPELLQQFLNSDNHHYQYWAIDKVIDKNGVVQEQFLPGVLRIIKGKNIFAAKYALQKIPDVYFAPAGTLQHWLWSVYKNSSYPLQIAILDKLSPIPFSDPLSEAVAQEMEYTSDAQFNVMLTLLAKQKRLSENVVSTLSRYLTSANADHAKAVYEVLTGRPVQHAGVKKKIRQYKNHHPTDHNN